MGNQFGGDGPLIYMLGRMDVIPPGPHALSVGVDAVLYRGANLTGLEIYRGK